MDLTPQSWMGLFCAALIVVLLLRAEISEWKRRKEKRKSDDAGLNALHIQSTTWWPWGGL